MRNWGNGVFGEVILYLGNGLMVDKELGDWKIGKIAKNYLQIY